MKISICFFGLRNPKLKDKIKGYSTHNFAFIDSITTILLPRISDATESCPYQDGRC